MKQKLIYILFFIASIGVNGLSQSMDAYINAADKAFKSEDYYSALEYYNTALEFDSTRTDLRYKLAESARLFNAYSTAINNYNLVAESDSLSDFPELTFMLGELYQKTGQYEDAIQNYELYISEQEGEDAYLTEKSKVEIEACKWAITEIDNIDPGVKFEHLDETVNTPYSEFGAVWDNDMLFFSSMKYEELKSDHNPNRLVSKVLRKTIDGLPEILPGEINNSNNSIAHTAFNKDNSKIFYTICDYLTDSNLKCDIYCREIDNAGNYINPMKLGINVDSDSITTTQPTVGYDPQSGMEFIIFSSNRNGGKGGLDLWKSEIVGLNQFSTPVNLTSINTAGNDITPFYHSESAILYFSSDGRRGLGGYDIFSADDMDGEFGNVIHQGIPANSSYNDIYYSLSSDEMTAHISSNRTGSYYIDTLQKACCYDIYKLNYSDVKIHLNILTYDALIMDSLSGVTVHLIDPVTGQTINSTTTPDGIDHLFELRKGRNYMIVSEKEGFNPDTVTITTRGKRSRDTINKKVYLTTDRLLLDLYTFDKSTLEELPGVTVEIFDMTSGEPIEFYSFENLKNNNFKIYVDQGRKYEVRGKKQDYSTAMIMLDTNQEFDSQIITRKLYLDRNDIDYFLPLTLFFDNDRPDRRSRDMYTMKSYTETYYPYIDRQDEFVSRWTRVNRNNKEVAEQEMVDFFEMDVKGGYQDFLSFLEKLHSYLMDGRRADISIKGYTSPLAASKYNLVLGQRRVSSVKNELRRYKNGVLMPYIDSGALTITDISYGEVLAPGTVSDRRTDTRNSIYSVDASKERKVTIVRVNIN